jgi:hypothetical protein
MDEILKPVVAGATVVAYGALLSVGFWIGRKGIDFAEQKLVERQVLKDLKAMKAKQDAEKAEKV